MQSSDEVIAVLCSDMHLCLNPPPCRSGEKNWLETQAGYLRQISDLAEERPVICAGDIFDKWDSPAELINFAMDALPYNVWAIPGQHDLPHHNLDDVRRSAYWTLVKSKRINDFSGRVVLVDETDLWAHGFAWGQEVRMRQTNRRPSEIHLAAIHAYCWMNGHKYKDAPELAEFRKWKTQLTGFDAAVFGDNHKGFLNNIGELTILNSGCLYRRRADEYHYKPRVGLLRRNGSIVQFFLDTSNDVFDQSVKVGISNDEENVARVKQFVTELGMCSDNNMELIDFVDAVRNWIASNPKRKRVAKVLMNALGI